MEKLRPTLTGNLVILQPRTESEIPTFTKWVNDPDVLRFSLVHPKTLEEERIWFAETESDPKEVGFSIYLQENEKLIGNCTIHRKDDPTEVSVGIIIGEKDKWGKGDGMEAMQLMVKYAKEELGVKRIWLTVDTLNERGLRCYKKVGFTICEKQKNPDRIHSNGENYVMEIVYT